MQIILFAGPSRLKDSFHRLWEHGTHYVDAEQIHHVLTSRQISVKPKMANVSGLQLADLIAHPSRTEILAEKGFLGRDLPPFARRVTEMLIETKYYRRGNQMHGRKFL
jgi:hypothetical protein